MNRLPILIALALGATGFACSGSPSTSSTGTASGTLTVHGTFAPSAVQRDNTRAIAVGADGRVFSAYLNSHGAFTLTLPVGHAYRISFVNSRANGSEVVLGHVVTHTSAGTQEFLGARAAGTIQLGAMSATTSNVKLTSYTSGNSGSGSSSGTGSSCNCGSGGGGGGGDDDDDSSEGGNYNSGGSNAHGSNDQGENNDDQGGDYSCHEHDDECDHVCQDDQGGDDEYYPENEPGDSCKSYDLDDDEGKSSCKSKTTHSCSGSNGEAGAPPVPPPPPAAAPPSTSTSGSCTVNADCGATAVCCGGACHTY